MRPIKLTMTAFGPYKDTETIHFEELEDHQLFVISGQTGSGKTTIFDGISFALYGSASGQDRENHTMLRSDFADDDTHTAVELIFEQRGRRFRILRQLGHVKQGNRTATGDDYEFFELVNGSEVPLVDRQMVSEINERVEQLIGLTQDQFKQIVMLPQGEFRKLLTSKTENKEQILRRLFKTETYERISDRLRVKKDQVSSDFKEVEQRRDHYIHHITGALPYRDESGLFQVLDEEHYNVNQLLNGLDEEIAFYQQQVKKDKEEYELAYKQHDKQQTAYHQAKAVNERFQELEHKQIDLNKLDDQKDMFKAKEKHLDEAQKASKITVYEQQVDNCRKDFESKNRAIEEAHHEQKTAEASVKQTKETYEQEKANEPKREEIRKQLDQLKEHLPTVKDIAKRKQTLADQQSKLKQQHQHLTTLQQKIQTNKENNDKLNEQIKKLDQAVSKETSKNNQLTHMREKASTIQEYKKYLKQQDELKKNLQTEEKSLKKFQMKYRSLEHTWLTNQASMLATHLHDGEACPVCGSYEHPEKASDAEGAVTREELDQAKQAFDKQDELYRNIRANLQANENSVKEYGEKVTDFDIPLEQAHEYFQNLVTKGKKLKEEVDQLQKDREQLDKLKEKHQKATDALTELEGKKDKLEQSFQTTKTDYEREKAVFEERLHNVPEDVRVLTVLEERINQTEETKRKMEQAWETVQTQLQTAEQALTKAETNVTNAHNQLKESETKLSTAEKQYHQALKDARFSTESEYTNAKMSAESETQLKQEIEQYNQMYATLTKQVTELKKDLAEKEKVNLEALAEQLNQLKIAYEQAFNERNTSIKSLEKATELHRHIYKADKEIADKEKELAMITDLHDVARGQNERKISFERYLQIDYLEQIIEAANYRLRNLSNGQFLLQRSDRQESYGRQSGLALDVHDAYTGQTRDVKTLSGGEKFNASLCLALGMSDVIQSFQGNVAIDTMFIDEGFGSLDEESLHKAIDTLIDLQETGRMIGVISHVEELKAIFPAVLQVEKTRAGYSEAKFVIK